MTDFQWDQHSNPAVGSGTSFGWAHPTDGVDVNGVLIWVEQSGSTANMNLTCTYGGVSVPIVSFTPETEMGHAYYRFFLGTGIPQLANATVSISRTAGPIQQPICLTTKGSRIGTKIANSVFRQFNNFVNPNTIISADDSALLFAPLHSNVDTVAGIGVNSPYSLILTTDFGSDVAVFCWSTPAGKTIPAGKTSIGFTLATSDLWSMTAIAIAEVFPGRFTSDTFFPKVNYKSADMYQKIFSWYNSLRRAVNPKTSIWRGFSNQATSIPAATFTIQPMTDLLIDTDNVGISSNGGWECPEDGIYLVNGVASVRSVSGGTDTRLVGAFNVNGVTGPVSGVRNGVTRPAVTAAQVYSIPIGPTLMSLDKGDEITVVGWQSCGATTAGAGVPSLNVRRLS